MRFLRRAIAAAFILVAAPFLAACVDGEGGGAPDGDATTRLVIETRGGPQVFAVEIADTDETRRTGLMFRTDLAADAGMLFDFGESRIVTMWMRNTPLPLDMIFITDAGRIAHIAENTVPGSEALISSRYPVASVLEVNAGIVAARGIAVGDQVTHPIFAKDDLSENSP